MPEETIQHDEDELSLKEIILQIQNYAYFLLRKWKVLLICAIIGLLGGLAYAMLSGTEYKATITFVTDGQEQVSPYAGLAANFGINLGNREGNNLFAGQNIYELMKTRRILESTLLTPVSINGDSTLLISEYIRMNKLRKKWRKDPHLQNLTFNIAPSDFTIYHDSVITSICDVLRENNLQFADIDPEVSILSATVVSADEQFSRLFAINMIRKVGQYYIETTTKTTRTTLEVMSKRLDSIKTQLYRAMGHVAAFSDNNANLVRQRPRVEQQKSMIKMEVNSAIYKQLVAAVENARMELQKKTPLFEVVDSPVLPLEKIRSGKIKCGIIGIILSLFLAAAWLLGRKYYKEIMAGE